MSRVWGAAVQGFLARLSAAQPRHRRTLRQEPWTESFIELLEVLRTDGIGALPGRVAEDSIEALYGATYGDHETKGLENRRTAVALISLIRAAPRFADGYKTGLDLFSRTTRHLRQEHAFEPFLRGPPATPADAAEREILRQGATARQSRIIDCMGVTSPFKKNQTAPASPR